MYTWGWLNPSTAYDIDWGASCEDIEVLKPVVRKTPDGEKCAKCKEFTMMAEPNQSDGKTFICYLCRKDPWR